MMYRMFTLAIAVACTAAPALAQQTERPCAQRNDVLAQLKDQYDEKPVGVGMTENGAVIELTTSESGTWSLVLSFPNGRSCLMATGESWEQAPAKLGTEIRF